jgi:tRNA A-37 threonylcarbamoyl transferase component Bud32
LNDLNLAQNAFKGPIPSELGGLDVLTTLNLSWNQFSGSIPSLLGSLHTLQVLDLSHNNLSGSIPSTLGQLMSLESANISYNDITGSLPTSWVKLLRSDPNSFVGNPRLCLNYSPDDQCMIVTSSSRKTHLGVILAVVVPSFVVFILVCSILVYFIFKRNSKRTLVGHENIEAMSALNSDISYNDIIDVTHNLSADFIIGKGAHGTVYKATMPNGNVVAVKKIISIDKDMQIHKSFLREIDTIGKIKHRNLVKFLGFCKWGDIGLLVYDYIPNGDLFKALHNTVKELDLNWNTRLKIAEGVANGLVYLHHDCIPPIIHRDIKSSNVLLDENLEAHITDFGVAKVMALKPKDDYATSTANIGGTYGYIAPGKNKRTHISFCLNIIVMQTWSLSFFIMLDLLMVDV